MNTKKQRQYEQIKAHGENLLAIFPNATERDPIALYKKLRRMEAKAQAIALRLCNGPEYPGGYDEVDALTGAILECQSTRPAQASAAASVAPEVKTISADRKSVG